MVFSRRFLLHLMPLEWGSLMHYSIVYTYVEQCTVAFFLSFVSFFMFIVGLRKRDLTYIFKTYRMVFGALSKDASL